MTTSRLSTILLALGLAACATSTGEPTDTTTYTHPGIGGDFPTGTTTGGTGANGTGAGSTTGTGGGTTTTTTTTDTGSTTTTTTSTTTTTDTGTGGAGGQPQCADADKRCAHLFSYPAGTESSVEVHGDFNGWGPGVAMTKNGAAWEASVPVPWNMPVQYKFVVDGTWLPDPANPNQVDDGYGGKNSELAAATCASWTCVQASPSAFDWRDAVMYFVFVDRFVNGNNANDGTSTPNVEQPADYRGGDWAGVKQKVDDGYFSDLGINVLWLTVPMDNTEDSGVGTDGHLYSAYHGYWPKNLDQPESRFGSMADLKALVDAAHAKGIKVILDYAMNHVHVSSPLYAQHNDWFWPKDVNGQSCICGSSACPWDGNMAKRCWFTDYLPDFDFTNSAARQASVDNAIWWVQQTGVDGFRLDAVKHIEDQWLYDLRSRVTTDIEPKTGQHFYMVGETYTGDSNLIKYYVNPAMLDGQFDFPMRARLIRSILMRDGGSSGVMSALDGFLAYNDTFYGSGVMSTFIGNHDVPRAIHFAEDNPVWGNEWDGGKDRAWSNQPGQPGGTAAYERLCNAFTLLYTSHGIPLVYYGDEVAMAGAGDPDNRRFMQWSGYSAGQSLVYTHMRKLGPSRAAHPALRKGTRTSVSSTADTLVYKMALGTDVVWVAINRADSAQTVSGLPSGQLNDELSGLTVTGPSFSVPARSSMILTQ